MRPNLGEQEFAERLRFEQLVSELAGRLVDPGQDGIDQIINDTLQKLGEFFGVERSLLFHFSDDVQVMSCSHEWHTAAFGPARPRLLDKSRDTTPWLFDKLAAGEVIVVERTASLAR